MVPPGRSRLPVSTLMVWTAHWQTTPCAWVDTPIRPWTAADGAAARSRARPRTASAGMPLTCSASSGVKGSTAPARRPHRRRRPRPGPVGHAAPQQLAHHSQQHRGVGPGPDEVVLVGDLGRLGAPRVDDDRRPPPAASSRRRGPGSRAPSTGSRSRPSGCGRRAPAGRCGRCRAPVAGTGARRAPRPRPGAAAGRPRWRRTCCAPGAAARAGVGVSAPRLCTLGLPW